MSNYLISGILKTDKINITVKIYGNFLETGIRFSAMHQAYKSGVKGLARYTTDGAVYFEAEGRTEQIKLFKDWCIGIAKKYGTKKPEITSRKFQGHTDFSIID